MSRYAINAMEIEKQKQLTIWNGGGTMEYPNHINSSPQVYVQLENLSHADPPYKSVAALNCVILGCANIWDINRAYETFVAIKEKFELSPDIHSYNALLCAFGKLKQVLLFV
jgi:hypothetical protein